MLLYYSLIFLCLGAYMAKSKKYPVFSKHFKEIQFCFKLLICRIEWERFMREVECKLLERKLRTIFFISQLSGTIFFNLFESPIESCNWIDLYFILATTLGITTSEALSLYCWIVATIIYWIVEREYSSIFCQCL